MPPTRMIISCPYHILWSHQPSRSSAYHPLYHCIDDRILNLSTETAANIKMGIQIPFVIIEVKHLKLNQFSDGSNHLGSGKCCCGTVGTVGCPLRYPFLLARSMWFTIGGGDLKSETKQKLFSFKTVSLFDV